MSETFNKYSIIWFQTYYEWRLNDVLLRTLSINDTINFPNSPSRVKISIWEGPVSKWAGTGIQWSQTSFSSFLSSLKITNISNNYNLQNNSLENQNNSLKNNSSRLKTSFNIYSKKYSY